MDNKVQKMITLSGNHSIPPIENLRRLAISESGFIFDPASGNSYTVNNTGLEVLDLLKQDIDLESVLLKLNARYHVSMRDMERDVLEYLSSLRGYIGAV